MTAPAEAARQHRQIYHRWRRCRIRVDANNFARLLRAADRRGIDPDMLLERLVATTLAANLIDAVLDDKE
jgi:hypothetical protein